MPSKYGSKWYNNGKISIQVKPGEEVPEGFKPGMVKTKSRYYNNGKVNKMIKEGDPVPEGFVLGMVPLSKEKVSEVVEKRKVISMNAVKRGAEILISVVLWAVILVAALFAFTTLATRDTNQVASLAGYTPLTVASDSMAPTFRAGDLIVIRKCDPAKLEEGDIITFHTIKEKVIALGFFDGVHLGHAALLRRTVEAAAQQGVTPA